MDKEKRVSLNVRLEPSLFAMLEEQRSAGWGLVQTRRNRSDVYNEMLGLGLQVNQLRKELGEHTFSKTWSLLNDPNVPWEKMVEIIPKVVKNKLNLDKISKLL